MNYELKEFKLTNSYLNDEKKKQIIDSLDQEINEMKKKYFLKQPNEVQPINRINEITDIKSNEIPLKQRRTKNHNNELYIHNPGHELSYTEDYHQKSNLSAFNNNKNNSFLNNTFSNNENNIYNTNKFMDNNSNRFSPYKNYSGSSLMKNKINKNDINDLIDHNIDNNQRFNTNSFDTTPHKNFYIDNIEKKKFNVINYEEKQDLEEENRDIQAVNPNYNQINNDIVLHHSTSAKNILKNKENNTNTSNNYNIDDQINFKQDFDNFNDQIDENDIKELSNNKKEINPVAVSFNPNYYKSNSEFISSHNNKINSLQEEEDEEILEQELEEMEEQPRDLEQEISMSMNQSMKESKSVNHSFTNKNSNDIKDTSNIYNKLNNIAISKDNYQMNTFPTQYDNNHDYNNKTTNTEPNNVMYKNINNYNDNNNKNQVYKKQIRSYNYKKPPNSTTNKNNTTNNSNYINKLLKDNRIKYKSKSKEKFEKLKEEIKEKFHTEHTFTPTTNYTFSKAKVKRDFGNQDDFYRRLSTPKLNIFNKRLKEKEERDSSLVKNECTFHPSISKTSRNIVNQKLKDIDNTVSYSKNKNNTMYQYENYKKGLVNERLFKLSEQLREKREKLKREYQEKVEKEFSYTPVIYETSKNMMKKYQNQPPLYERYNEVMQNKSNYLGRIKSNKENGDRSQFNNFQPKINRKSKEIMNRKANQSSDKIYTNANDRLYYQALERKTNPKDNKTLQERELDNCTFIPNLNNSAYNNTQYSYISGFKEGMGNINDFLNRQKIYEEIKKEKHDKTLSKSIDNITKPFHPRINSTSDILTRADHDRAKENFDDKVDRLYRKNYDKIQNRKKNLEEFYYSQYDFKPKINQVSKFVGRDANIYILSQKPNITEKLDEWKKVENDDDECTFKPKLFLNINYSHVNSNYKIDENTGVRIQEELISKSEKLEEIKRQIELQNNVEEKFKPKINKNMPVFEFNEPLMLKGFAKHIEKMEKARQVKRELEEREKEVFVSGENWSRDNLITIPKPFQLSYMSNNIQKKREEIKSRVIYQENKDCTFKPQTNEGKNKQVIKMLLQN